MILEIVCVGPMQVNCYILAPKVNSPTIIIDPGQEGNKIKRRLREHKLTPALIINTHGHMDHIGCDDDFGVPIYIHSQDVALLTDSKLNLSAVFMSPITVKSEIRPVEEKSRICLEGIELGVIHTPGHTPGGIALYLEKPQGSNIVFTGDSLFFQGIGRTDFPGASEELLVKSIRDKLFKLPDETKVYPGHGPSTTIGREKKENPFLI